MPPTIESLRSWSQILFWVSVIFPIIGVGAGVLRYYVDRAEKKVSSQLTAAEIRQARDDASSALAKQEKSDAALRELEVSAAEARKSAEALAALKRTPPRVAAQLARFKDGDQFAVVLTAQNLVPFRALWSISTEQRRDVGGIMLEEIEFHPTEANRSLNIRVNLNKGKIVNEYLELDIRYTSIYFAELGNPKELRVEESTRYRYKNGNIYPWDFKIDE